ncbi:MAG: hypothetical protein R3B82_29605 [Sandaracinaceae bacterium]
MSEVILGYLMLGGVISIFSNKLARRGGVSDVELAAKGAHDGRTRRRG